MTNLACSRTSGRTGMKLPKILPVRLPGNLLVGILVIPLVLTVVVPVAWAQMETAVADTSADGSISYSYSDPLAENLTTEQKIAGLNALILQTASADAVSRLYNDLGVIYAQQEQWETAREAFLSAVQKNATEGDFHRNLGLVLIELEQYEFAVHEFRAYQQFDKLGGVDMHRLIGQAHWKAGNNEEARQAFLDGLAAMAPDYGTEGMRLVLALNQFEAEVGNLQAVRDLLEEYLQVAQRIMRRAGDKPDYPGAHQAELLINNLMALYTDDAKVLEESGFHAEAAEIYKKAYELTLERDDLLPKIVDAYINAGDQLHARVTTRLARSDLPDAFGTWLASGKVYESENRLEEAVAAYVKAHEIDPDRQDLKLVIGQLYMRMGDTENGRKFLAEGISSSDSPPEVVYNYAVSLMREKKYSAAIRPLQRVVREKPELAQAWAALGLSLRMSKRYTSAIAPYQKALELNPDPKLAYNLGICCKKAGQVDAAITAYQRALALKPRYVEARYNLSLVLMDAKRYEDAIDSFDRLLELEPDSYRCFYSQGLCFYYLGRYDEALEKYDLALEQRETANVYNNIGLVYDKLGKTKQSIKFYNEAKKLKGGS